MPRIKERWKPIKDYEGFYEVSNLGKVRSVTRTVIKAYKSGKRTPVIYQSKELSQATDRHGYQYVILHRERRGKRFDVHRLVAQAFIGDPPDPKAVVHHKDGSRDNNRARNLEYVSHAQNIAHSFKGKSKTIKYQGLELTLLEWSRRIAGNDYIVRNRLARGWTDEEAVAVPFGMTITEFREQQKSQ
ncbi:NUMOD4 motif-containing HNH endonuclease [Picosynechococcus sp. PCC 7117]|uniref:NUMOD4 motif-containing HNH endonuclease n=1 Tax=Picosynechococcus sp. PCC 7117 TaxID=195498 RepID=UPI0008109050|nr:NUMOD4 motif-containing HNH endonuclease [Picosynechococcus sp. PCC 7117]ANV88514.1 hypothetical protein AWQ22_14160 [Picosynechococcus sp. PCC 7117]